MKSCTVETKNNSDLPETEEFAKLVNQLMRAKSNECFYEHKEFIDSSLSCNTLFNNQDKDFTTLVTPLSWLLGANPNKKIYSHGVSLLLQHPELRFRTFCNLDLYVLPIVLGNVDVIKEMQGYGIEFNLLNLNNLMLYLKNPIEDYKIDTLLPALNQVLSDSYELNNFSKWINPLIGALQIPDGKALVDIILREMRILLLSKISLYTDFAEFYTDIQSDIDKYKNQKECETVTSLITEHVLNPFKEWYQIDRLTARNISDMPEGTCKKTLLDAKFNSLTQTKPCSPLSFAVANDDRELLQTLLLFEEVRELEMEDCSAIKTAITNGHSHLINILAKELSYKNLKSILSYTLEEKNYNQNTYSIIAVLSNLKNANAFFDTDLLSQALIKANKNKHHKLASVLMRNLHYFLKKITADFNKEPKLKLLRENVPQWKIEFIKHLENLLFAKQAILPIQMQFLCSWGLRISLASMFPDITIETQLPKSLTRQDLHGLCSYLFSWSRLENAYNVALMIAMKNSKTYEEAQFCMACNLNFNQGTKKITHFDKLTNYINAFCNLFESGSYEIFTTHSQYVVFHNEIVDILDDPDFKETADNQEITSLRDWADLFKNVAENYKKSNMTYLLLNISAKLLEKIKIKTNTDILTLVSSMHVAAIALLEIPESDLWFILEKFKQLHTRLVSLLQPSIVTPIILEKFTACIRIYAHVYMKFTPTKVIESNKIYETGITLLKEKIPQLELKDDQLSIANKHLALVLSDYANQNNKFGNHTIAQNFGLEALKFHEKSATSDTDQLILARYHFNLSGFYNDDLEMIESTINHLESAVQIFLSVKPKGTSRDKEEQQDIYLYRSSLANQLYIYAIKIFRDNQDIQKSKALLKKAAIFLEQVQVDNNSKLNCEDLALLIRIYGQALAFEPGCLIKFNNLEKFVNAFFEYAKKSDQCSKEYALGCLQLGSTLLFNGDLEKGRHYLYRAVKFNPLKGVIDTLEENKQTVIADKSSLLYLADAYKQLVLSMQCNKATDSATLADAKDYLSKAIQCYRHMGNMALTYDHKRNKEKIMTLQVEITKIIQFQSAITRAADLKVEQQKMKLVKNNPEPDKNPKKTKKEQPKKSSPSPAKKTEDKAVNALLLQANQLKDIYNTKLTTALSSIEIPEQIELLKKNFTFFTTEETDLIRINQAIDTLDSKLKEFKQQPKPMPLTTPSITQKAAKNKPPKKRNKNKNKKKAEQLAQKHEALKKHLVDEQKRTPPLEPKKTPPSPEQLRIKIADKIKEQNELAALQELENQRLLQAEQLKKQQLEQQALREQEADEKLKALQLINEQTFQERKYTRGIESFGKKLEKEAEDEKLKRQAKRDSNSTLFAPNMFGLTLFNRPSLQLTAHPLELQPEQTNPMKKGSSAIN